MASRSTLSTVLLLIITVIHTVGVTAVPETECNSLLSALRNRGYHVFANAITTTDLYYDIISGGNYTFFAPVDSVLYTLDMSMSAGDYTTTMRFHVVPHRLSFSDLRTLPYGLSSFPTLLTDHEMHIVNPLPLPLPIIVEGVYIAVPDLYYDTHIAVHGLESILDYRSRNDTVNSSSVTQNLTPDHTPMSDVHRVAHAPSPQAVNTSVVTGIDTVAVASPAPLPQTEAKSGPAIQSIQPPETKPGPVSQSIQPTETKSETIIQTHRPPETYFESITQPLEEHATIATRSQFVPQRIHHVSLAAKSTGIPAEEFSPVDDSVISCPFTEDDRPQLSIANIRRGDPYMRELYTPTEMTCAHA